MTPPDYDASKPKSTEVPVWSPFYYNEFQGDLSSSLDSCNSMSFGESLPLKNYTSYASSTPHSLFSSMNAHSLSPEMNLHVPYMPDYYVPQTQNMYQPPNHTALQDVYRDTFLGMGLNETDSSVGSPSFDVSARGSVISTLSDTRQDPASPVDIQRAVKQELQSSPRGLGITKVKKHKRKHIMNRSRLGCWICRIKHLKCDESKPTCNNCLRFGIECDYSEERPAYVSDKNLRRQKLDAIITKKRRRAINPTPMPRASAPEYNNVRQAPEEPPFLKPEWMVFLADT